MASLQHYVCDAGQFPIHVINKHQDAGTYERARHFAALIIQTVWRGYVVRQRVKKWNQAATTIQRHLRGFLVRWHLPEFLDDYWYWFTSRYINIMATRIQALWRGYRVRSVVCIKLLRGNRAQVQQINEEITEYMRTAFEEAEKERIDNINEESKKWVMYILYKLHHHLRTSTKEGVYSLHGKMELSPIEYMLSNISLVPYMKYLRHIYYKAINKEKSPPQYMFKSRRLQKDEDFYRQRDNNLLFKDVTPKPNIECKRFCMDPKIPRERYQRLPEYSRPYSPRKYVPRPYDKSKHISNTDFNLHAYKKVNVKLKPPPYYITYWTSRCCTIHSICDS